MVTGNWLNKDNLFLKFGTSKAAIDRGGEYKSLGETREIEIELDLSTLVGGAAAVPISDNTFFPATANAAVYVDSVELIVVTACATFTALSVGTMKLTDRVTALSDTAFVNALAVASINTAGKKVIMTNGSTSAGGYIGVPSVSEPAYITAKVSGSTGTGFIKIRIKYTVTGSITQ